MEIHSFLGVTNEMVYLVGLPVVFALIAIEVLVMAVKRVRYYKRDDTLGTLGMLAGNLAMGAVTKSLFFACMVWTYQYRLFDLQAALPPWLLCLVALFLIDLMFYMAPREPSRALPVGYSLEPSLQPRVELRRGISPARACTTVQDTVFFLLTLPWP